MNLLKVSGISKREGKVQVLEDISFTQQALQKVAIAGATGSGKTTLLKIIGGRGQADAGEVLFENKRVPGLMEKLIPGHPGIAYLSQHFELRNNYRVEEELEYMNELPMREAAALYEICRIEHLLKRKTDQLSGGERQRISLARLLGASPRLLLLDEPYSNLDPFHRGLLKSVIRDIGEQLGITCVLVSHDPQDTLSWADEILVLQEGRIVQMGSPEQVYRHPINEYTAGLFGKYNRLGPEQMSWFPALQEMDSQECILRPEQFIPGTGDNGVKGLVQEVNFAGSYYEIAVQLPGYLLLVNSPVRVVKGEEVRLLFDPAAQRNGPAEG